MAEFTHEMVEGVLIVRISGKFDFGIYEDLLVLFDRELKGRGKPVVLNLARVEGITSSGISVLAKLSMEQSLKVASAPDDVRELLELSGIAAILDVVRDEVVGMWNELPGKKPLNILSALCSVPGSSPFRLARLVGKGPKHANDEAPRLVESVSLRV